ncbi:MAG: hypothetical protein EBT86_12120, partial [Actinobacteria bacterium]|nr:hypothetical protein [Actinomycetota bacterium]
IGIKLTKNYCNHPHCTNIAKFRRIGTRHASYCSTHVPALGFQRILKYCLHPSCETTATFGKAVELKSEGEVDWFCVTSKSNVGAPD